MGCPLASATEEQGVIDGQWMHAQLLLPVDDHWHIEGAPAFFAEVYFITPCCGHWFDPFLWLHHARCHFEVVGLRKSRMHTELDMINQMVHFLLLVLGAYENRPVLIVLRSVPLPRKSSFQLLIVIPNLELNLEQICHELTALLENCLLDVILLRTCKSDLRHVPLVDLSLLLDILSTQRACVLDRHRAPDALNAEPMLALERSGLDHDAHADRTRELHLLLFLEPAEAGR